MRVNTLAALLITCSQLRHHHMPFSGPLLDNLRPKPAFEVVQRPARHDHAPSEWLQIAEMSEPQPKATARNGCGFDPGLVE